MFSVVVPFERLVHRPIYLSTQQFTAVVVELSVELYVEASRVSVGVCARLLLASCQRHSDPPSPPQSWCSLVMQVAVFSTHKTYLVPIIIDKVSERLPVR